MPDDKDGREDQAQASERRQREREITEELERMHEEEPPVESAGLEELEQELDALTFPARGTEIVAALGDQVIELDERSYKVEELVPDADEEVFETPVEVRARVQRPTVAAAMKRIVEVTREFPEVDLGRSQRDAYEKTFRALKSVDTVDDDEGIRAISDWIIEQVRDKRKLPGSRAVRRQAATFCRSHGYQIRNDEWLGI